MSSSSRGPLFTHVQGTRFRRDTDSRTHPHTYTRTRRSYKVIVQCSYYTARHRHVKTARQNLMSIVFPVFLAPKTSAGPRFSTENFPPKKNCFQQISTTCARPRKKTSLQQYDKCCTHYVVRAIPVKRTRAAPPLII